MPEIHDPTHEPEQAAASGGGWGPPAGTTPASGVPGWGGPPPSGPGWPPPDWGSPRWGWQVPGPAAAPSRRPARGLRPAAAVALLAGAVGASALASHALWKQSTTPSAAAATTPSTGSGNTGLPGVSPGGASGSDGSGNDGTGPGGPGGASGTSASEGSGSPANVDAVAAKIDPAVVDINTRYRYQSAAGAGTGIVLTATGEILTNNHVINGATSISVTDIGNGRTYQADVVGYDAADDVAVLQLVGASGLQTASLDSSAAKVDLPVVAVGNAGGAGGTPSAAGGSVTGVDQQITASDELNGTSETLTGLIQTNADVQPGDSGGPLVDASGRVVGMDTAASSRYSLQMSASQGYAIPITKALSIAGQIEAGQASSTVHVGPTAFLGVMISSGGTQGSVTSPFGSPFSSGSPGTSTPGAVIAGVVPGGAAANGGLARGDVITGLDGRSVSSPRDVSNVMAAEKPGQSLSITWTDTSGSSHTSTVTLQSGPPA